VVNALVGLALVWIGLAESRIRIPQFLQHPVIGLIVASIFWSTGIFAFGRFYLHRSNGRSPPQLLVWLGLVGALILGIGVATIFFGSLLGFMLLTIGGALASIAVFVMMQRGLAMKDRSNTS
jgi:hypothetical protein